ncbi:uncharacterized protein TRIADDRAFT_62071 [Trichoplax adhaerens]|uniref:Death domain-containing protein n=1 Tax=Trichoplax adhaerens TaxID=10228 RepID=B3SCR6_TRIAD|nr:predicted protein [Trichoplax adhaerens]EDV19518.1 predicted protein [Trichoplax adhaerens]|eukprot:XP_002118035.1 predicted protein [Trichoplax adhaerens]
MDQRDIQKIIAENNGSVDDQCAQMLSMYASRKGRSYTKSALVEALFKSGLRSVAEDHRMCKVISTYKNSKRKSNAVKEDEIPLRELPPTSISDYIIRKDIVNKICDKLKNIDESPGHALIHGMAGSGKTIAVCQSVRQAVSNGCFKSNGCYWMKIGNISNDELSQKLKVLGVSLGTVWNKNIKSIREVCEYLDNYLRENSKIANTLFIFDDVSKKDHYKYFLSFAKKSIVTSRLTYDGIQLNFDCFNMPERLTPEESVELLALHHVAHSEVLRANPIIKNVFESCAYLPLAISEIGGLNLSTNEEWNTAKNSITGVNTNLYGVLQSSIESLSESDRELFKLLAVFKRASIPIESISSVWSCDDKDANRILKEMQNRSLLTYVEGSKYWVLHGLMLDHLRLQVSNQDYDEKLSKKLIDGYRSRCRGRWYTFPDDDYFYQNSVCHAILGKCDKDLQSIMTDFNWMSRKIESDNEISGLINDITNYMNYCKKNHQDWKKFDKVLAFLQDRGKRLKLHNVNLVEQILTSDITDEWMKQRALELATETNNDKEYLKAYYEALKEGSRNKDFIKIVIGGPENVGKTSIINAFLNDGSIEPSSETEIANDIQQLIKLTTFDVLDRRKVDYRIALKEKVYSYMINNADKQNIKPLSTRMEQNCEGDTSSASKNFTTNVNSEGEQHVENDIITSNKIPTPAITDSAMKSSGRDYSDLSTSNELPTSATADTEMKSLERDYGEGAISANSTPALNHESNVVYDPLQALTKTSLEDKMKTDVDSQYGKFVDFGGQAVYYVTHRPFLSGKSLYILVFNITRTFDDNIIDRDGNEITMTYRQAMQEWLTSMIGSYNDAGKVKVTIDEKEEEFHLPVIILIASHGDLIKDEKKRLKKFDDFSHSLAKAMPPFAKNLCSSRIIFHCKPTDHTPASIDQRRKTSEVLHDYIQKFATALLSLEKIPVKWYIMTSLLHIGNPRNNKTAAVETQNNEIISKIGDIMTFEEIKQLSQNYNLYEDDEKFRYMLRFLHDIGDIVFCEEEGLDGIIVTNLDWLLDILRSIIKLGNPSKSSIEPASISKNEEVNLLIRNASKTGKLSEKCINFVIKKFNLDKKKTEYILRLMEHYSIICKIENVNKDHNSSDDLNRLYFVPYLLRSSAKVKRENYWKSDWLYIGYDSTEIPYIPDGIFYCHLSACLKVWNNPKVEAHDRCAIFYMEDCRCRIVVEKKDSFIGMQLCYGPSSKKLSRVGKKRITKSIRRHKPHFIIRDKLKKVIAEKMPKFDSTKCQFYFKCGGRDCKEMIDVANKLCKKKTAKIKCSECMTKVPKESVNQWQIFEEELADFPCTFNNYGSVREIFSM